MSVPRLQADTDLREFIERWSRSEELGELLALFRAGVDPTLPTGRLLGALEEASAVWDHRAARERNLVSDPELDPVCAARADVLLAALGLDDAAPPLRAAGDHVLVLGGLARACLARTAAAARLCAAAPPRQVIALSALRPVNARETPVLEAFGLHATTTELDVALAGVRRAFPELGELETTGRDDGDETQRWRTVRGRCAGHDVEVVAAPSSVAGRRATTVDTYAWLAASGRLADGAHALLVTTHHYRLYQLLDAIRVLGLPHGLRLDAVGIRPGEVDPRLAWTPTTSAVLQELRSTIRSLQRLHGALCRRGGSRRLGG